jgi:hypothetical protein
MIAFVFISCLIGCTVWLLCSVAFGTTRQDFRAPRCEVSARDRSATGVGIAADIAASPWTALDDHQLNRLLDGPSS